MVDVFILQVDALLLQTTNELCLYIYKTMYANANYLLPSVKAF